MRSCPDFRTFKKSLLVHIQTFEISKDFRAFMFRLLCVQKNLMRSFSDFRAFAKFSCISKTFGRSKKFVGSYSDFRELKKLSCVHVQTFVRSLSFRAFKRVSCVHVQTFGRSKKVRWFIFRLSRFQKVFVRSCSDFRAFKKF